MSTFKVKLIRNTGSGTASDPTITSGVSLQRTMEVTGPNAIRRILKDGETFTSSNYWKRYASVADGGPLAEEHAIVSVVSDDGTVWSDTDASVNRFAVVEDVTVTGGTVYTDAGNEIDVVATYGGVSLFTQIVTDEDIKVKLNGSDTAILNVAAGTQTFDNNDLPISKLAFSNAESGATDATVQVLMSIQIVSAD